MCPHLMESREIKRLSKIADMPGGGPNQMLHFKWENY